MIMTTRTIVCGIGVWIAALVLSDIYNKKGSNMSSMITKTQGKFHIMELEGMSNRIQQQQHSQTKNKNVKFEREHEIEREQEYYYSTSDIPPNNGNGGYTDAALRDMIVKLPGLHYNPGFNQFAGYIKGASSTRHLFYWYVESQSNPAKDPVVLWTNGGPGCSGLLGFGTEHGPFHIDGNGTLTENPYSWNRIANMLYIEQPAGVGFSYFDTEPDRTTGDDQAAEDNYYFILNFLERFPERKSNPFYISSESYGGHYMPQLAMSILRNDFLHDKINFRGMMVGNPYVDPYTNTVTQIRAYYNHGLIAKPLFDRWVAECENPDTFETDPCLDIEADMFDQFGPGINPYALDYPVCFEKAFLADEVYEFDLHPDVQDSNAIRLKTNPSMTRTSEATRIHHYRHRKRHHQQKKHKGNVRRQLHATKHRRHHHHHGKKHYDDDDFFIDDDSTNFFTNDGTDDYPSADGDDDNIPRTYSSQVDKFLSRNNVNSVVAPSFLPPADNGYKACSEVHLERFLNRHDVRKALHVKDEGGYLWSACTDDIVYSDKDFDKSVINEYRELIKMAIARSSDGTWINDLNMLIFSGDDDSIASTAGTQAWIWDLGLPAVSHDEWKAWIVDGQTAGFVVHYLLPGSSNSTFVFATVHGAGHEVPAYRPYEALELFARYLDRTL